MYSINLEFYLNWIELKRKTIVTFLHAYLPHNVYVSLKDFKP